MSYLEICISIIRRNFNTSEVLTESYEKTIEVNDNLADVINDEGIYLEPDLAISYITVSNISMLIYD